MIDGWTPKDIKEMRANKLPFLCHAFEGACADLDVEHRLTKPRHPWTNGQVERMNRTIKEATVKRYHYETHDQLRQHLTDFVAAYNFARLRRMKLAIHDRPFAQCTGNLRLNYKVFHALPRRIEF